MHIVGDNPTICIVPGLARFHINSDHNKACDDYLNEFGVLRSGILLHGKYEAKGHEIDDRLQAHIDIVNAMNDTFTTAHMETDLGMIES